MKRRNFLKSVGFVMATPAIIKSENLMKLWVPKQSYIENSRVGEVYFDTTSTQFWQMGESEWESIVMVRESDETKYYLNGVENPAAKDKFYKRYGNHHVNNV